MRILAGLFVWFSFAIAAPLHAQMATQCPDCLSAEAAREDLRVLYETLQQEHVDLFARRTREEYDAHINRLVESIAQPITTQEFHLVLQDAMSFGKIGHAKTEAPLADVMGHVQAGGGVVADSDPETEYQESFHKARALMRAVQQADRGSAP